MDPAKLQDTQSLVCHEGSEPVGEELSDARLGEGYLLEGIANPLHSLVAGLGGRPVGQVSTVGVTGLDEVDPVGVHGSGDGVVLSDPGEIGVVEVVENVVDCEVVMISVGSLSRRFSFSRTYSRSRGKRHGPVLGERDPRCSCTRGWMRPWTKAASRTRFQ